MAIAPEESGDFTDGTAMNISTMSPEAAALGYHWNIKIAGVYRIVININTKKVTIYSPETDPKPMVVSWTWNNNTVIPLSKESLFGDHTMDGLKMALVIQDSLWLIL